jgi:hypothetical protein
MKMMFMAFAPTGATCKLNVEKRRTCAKAFARDEIELLREDHVQTVGCTRIHAK